MVFPFRFSVYNGMTFLFSPMNLTWPNRQIPTKSVVQITVCIFNIQYECFFTSLPVSLDGTHTRKPSFNCRLIVSTRQVFTAMLHCQDATYMFIRPVLTDGNECWSLRRNEENTLQNSERKERGKAYRPITYVNPGLIMNFIKYIMK